MATQSDVPGLPVYYDYQQQGVRLLELPQELQEQLSRLNPPSLAIKAAPDDRDPNPSLKASHAVLCTRDHTFQLRQVQSSNTLFLLRPQHRLGEEEDIPPQSVSVFATCNGTLEVPNPSNGDKGGTLSAMQWMKEILPLCSLIAEVEQSDSVSASKPAIFSTIPHSQQELEDAWTELVAFELHSQSFRPSSSLLASFWTDLVQSAVAEGIDLSSQFTYDELWETIQELQYPQPLLASLIAKLSRKNSISLQSLSLDPERTISWLANTLSQSEALQRNTENLLERMKVMLPEPWHSFCTEARIASLLDYQKFDNNTELKASQGDTTLTEMDNKRKATGRNWHEKFKKGRK